MRFLVRERVAMVARVAMAARRAVKGKAGNGKGKAGKGGDGGKAHIGQGGSVTPRRTLKKTSVVTVFDKHAACNIHFSLIGPLLDWTFCTPATKPPIAMICLFLA